MWNLLNVLSIGLLLVVTHDRSDRNFVKQLKENFNKVSWNKFRESIKENLTRVSLESKTRKSKIFSFEES